jgi:uncharacterized membrane protein
MSWIALTGYSGVAILVIGWLVVSFTPAGPRRAVIEWIAACGLYVALLMLFTNLARSAWEQGSTFALVAFGFLVVLFGGGLLVCLTQTLLALRGSGATQSSATN